MNGLKFYFLFIRVTRLPSGISGSDQHKIFAKIYVYNKREFSSRQRRKAGFHRRGTEFAEFGVFLIKNLLLRALRGEFSSRSRQSESPLGNLREPRKLSL